MEHQFPVHRFTIRELKPGAKSSALIVREARRLGFEGIRAVLRSEIYFVRGNIAPEELGFLGRFLLSDPVTQTCEIHTLPQRPEAKGSVIEVAYHPGVTDPVADEILRSGKELGIQGIDAALTGLRYEIDCEEGCLIEAGDLDRLASRLLANPVVQRWALGPVEPSFPGSTAETPPEEWIPIHTMDQEGLAKLNRARRAALDPEEMEAIREYFASQGRACSDVEFEMIAQTWSEHCFHKTFKALIDIENAEAGGLPGQVDNILKTYIKAATDEIDAPWVISAFKDNAGIIEFDKDFDLSFKVETHNHPSAIEPFGGANTGVGGVIRDVMAVSARPFAVTDVLCFGIPGRGEGTSALSVEQIRSGVVAGVQDYGNKMGIPTLNGSIHYHEKYAANPLVYCGCAGIAPRGAFFSEPRVGDRILVLGGRTGRDGIRGATFSSMTMDGSTLETAGASVQIGAPLVEKKLSELILAARDARLYSGITDCGAGGLSSAVGEMASELGADVELSEVRLKYPGLAPWEIWLSEAQERMVLAVPPGNLAALAELCDANDVEYCDLGFFTGSGRLLVRFRGKAILDLDCEFLHKGMPRRRMKAAPPAEFRGRAAPQNMPGADIPGIGKLFQMVMGHHALCSKEWAIRRYDHEVQGATRLGPFAGKDQAGPSDAAVAVPLETGLKRGVAISNGFNPRYGEADSYNAAASALDEAVRNAVAAGADPDRIAVMDNFCWGDPLKPENLWTLLRAAKACKDAAIAHRTPFVSGKDSFNNEFEGPGGEKIAVPPSLLISAMGIVPELAAVRGSDLKRSDSLLYLIGEFSPLYEASVLMDILEDRPGRAAPGFSTDAPAVYRALHAALKQGLVEACHDLSEGGLGAALAEMCLAGGLGADIDIDSLKAARRDSGGLAENADVTNGNAKPASPQDSARQSLLLFGETNGCLLAEVTKDNAPELEQLLAGLPFARIGTTTGAPVLSVRAGERALASLRLEELQRAYLRESAEILDQPEPGQLPEHMISREGR
ncbi:MAG: phosphoribosylformylglycinamidine synthase subunit PurS [Spirochaetia bacterium]|jgi:phosphoribosylformylglycinamidine synthase|nr:phosphoribosylformylglycinamidine synthase subunit PurS [Spirochaetia bacterium]